MLKSIWSVTYFVLNINLEKVIQYSINIKQLLVVNTLPYIFLDFKMLNILKERK